MYDKNTTIDQFLSATAARQPTPGGGSVAALAGALASAMGEMVLNFSVGKKGLEQHADALKAALGEYHRARLLMLGLMEEDQSAYEAFSAARKLSPDSPQRAAAAAACIRVPQTLAAAAVAVLDVTDKIADQANRFLLSDLAVCADLAMAATRAALYNVRVNLPEIADAGVRGQMETTSGQLLARAVMLIQRVSPRIWQRIARGS